MVEWLERMPHTQPTPGSSGWRSFAACHIPLSLSPMFPIYLLHNKGVYARKKSYKSCLPCADESHDSITSNHKRGEEEQSVPALRYEEQHLETADTDSQVYGVRSLSKRCVHDSNICIHNVKLLCANKNVVHKILLSYTQV